MRQPHDRLSDLRAHFLAIGREITDQGDDVRSLEGLELNGLLPHKSPSPSHGFVLAQLRLVSTRSSQDEGRYPFQPPRDEEQDLPARRIEELQIIECQQHRAVVRHSFHHSDDGLGHPQANRFGGRIGRGRDAGINRPEARTHAAGLCQPERLRAARRRIASQRTDELSDRSVGNALTDFLTRHHEYRPSARLD